MLSRPNCWLWRPCKSATPLWAEWSFCSRVWIECSVRNTVPSVALTVCNIWTPSGESGKMYSDKNKVVCVSRFIYNLFCPFRSLWHGMLVVASFIQHVIFKVQQNDSRLKELALKHCNLHLNVSKKVLGSVFSSWYDWKRFPPGNELAEAVSLPNPDAAGLRINLVSAW